MITKRILSIVAVATAALVCAFVTCRYATGEEGRRATVEGTEARALPVSPEVDEPDEFDLSARADEIRQEIAEERARERARIFDVLDAIDELQPYFRAAKNPNAARRRLTEKTRLAQAIDDAAERHEIDPLLAVAMARRESSLHPIVGSGRRDGALGERGYFQIYPNGYAERTCGLDDGVRCDQYDARCNAQTALCYLAEIRQRCGDDPWIYVGGYGRTRCPRSRIEAQSWSEVVTARDFYCEIADCENEWPM